MSMDRRVVLALLSEKVRWETTPDAGLRDLLFVHVLPKLLSEQLGALVDIHLMICRSPCPVAFAASSRWIGRVWCHLDWKMSTLVRYKDKTTFQRS